MSESGPLERTSGRGADASELPPLKPAAPPPRRRFVLRRPVGAWSGFVLGALGIAICLLIWWFVTRGERSEDRLINRMALPSPSETWSSFGELWRDHALARNIVVSLRRVAVGFALAALVGIPLGVLAGCFPPVGAMLAPLLIFGRNIPMAALIILTFFLFGVGEVQKVMFIFLACVAFVISDTATSIANVNQSYVDTAYTLGVSRWQVIMKTLVPLALPKVFDSLRLLFGLAFGYIMLAEAVRLGSEEGGLGNLILNAQRRSRPEYIYIIILVIPIVALAMDRVFFWIQRQLFPFRYGGSGFLLQACQRLMELWEQVKGWILPMRSPYKEWVAEWRAERQGQPVRKTNRVNESETEWRP